MRFVRIIYRDHWNENAKKFQSTAFSGSKGISVFSCNCVEEKQSNICQHISNFYSPEPTGLPPIYWVIEFDDLLVEYPEVKIVQHTEENLDDCHHNIFLPPKIARRFFKSRVNEITQFQLLRVCSNNNLFELDDLN